MFAILVDPVRPDLHVRAVRRQTSARAGRSSRAMAAVLLVGAVVAMHARVRRQPAVPGRRRPGGLGNMEGKEVRFGAALGGLFGGGHDRHEHRRRSTPGMTASSRSAGLVPLFNMELGEITPGGIGAGHVRDARHRRDPGGVHRRPDGRPDARVPRQEGRGVRDQDGDARRPRPRAPASSASRRIASVLPEGLAGPLNPGPHGFSEILYAFSSQTGNNGSAFAGPDRQHALLQHHRRRSRCSSAATG